MTTPLPPTDPSAADTQLPGEAELAALYRQLPQNEPGPALDAAVLRAAARALENGNAPAISAHAATHVQAEQPATPDTTLRSLRPHASSAHAQRRKTPRWIIGLSTAASLMLAAGLAWHMRSMPVSAPAYTDHAPAELAASATPSEAKAFAPSAPVAARTPPLPVPAMAAAMDKTIAAKPMPHEYPPAQQQASRQATDNSVTATPASRVRAPANAPSAIAKPAPEKLIAAKSHESYQAMPSPPPAVEEVSASAVAAPAPAPPAPPAAPAQPVIAPATQPASPATVNADASATPSTGETPAQELAAIQQLFAQGKTDEARRRLIVFRHDHPQWSLPAALQAQLPKP